MSRPFVRSGRRNRLAMLRLAAILLLATTIVAVASSVIPAVLWPQRWPLPEHARSPLRLETRAPAPLLVDPEPCCSAGPEDEHCPQHCRSQECGIEFARCRCPGSPSTIEDRAFEWLKHRQRVDGSFPGLPGRDVGTTGVVVACLLSHGETHQSGRYRSVVRRGLEHLNAEQGQSGWLGPEDGDRALFNHSRATLALTVAYSATGSRVFRDPSRRALAALRDRVAPEATWVGDRAGDSLWIVLCVESAIDGDGEFRTWRRDLASAARRCLDARQPIDPRDHAACVLAISLDSEEPVPPLGDDWPETPRWNDGSVDPDLLLARTLVYRRSDTRRWLRWAEPLEEEVFRHQIGLPDRQGCWQLDVLTTSRGSSYDTALVLATRLAWGRYPSVMGVRAR